VPAPAHDALKHRRGAALRGTGRPKSPRVLRGTNAWKMLTVLTVPSFPRFSQRVVVRRLGERDVRLPRRGNTQECLDSAETLALVLANYQAEEELSAGKVVPAEAAAVVP
jgi:hypothetical protein